MTIPKITPYSGGVANPDGSQTQTEFTQNMFDQLSYEAQLASELNATVNATNTTALEVNSNASIAQNSADSAQASANFEGDFTVGVTSAVKGKSYVYNGNVWRCLQNTTTTPSTSNSAWKLSVGEQYVTEAQEDLLPTGSSLFKGDDGVYLKNGDTVPSGTTHLRVLVGGKPTIAAISPIASGVVSLLTQIGATVGGKPVLFQDTANPYRKKTEVDVILVDGQSNARGYAASTPGAPATNTPLGRVWDGSEFIPLTSYTPTANDGTSTGSAWAAFGNEYARLTGRNHVILNAAKGSQSISQLQKGGVEYTAMEDWFSGAVAAILAEGNTVGKVIFMFCQGEADAILETTPVSYYSQLSQLWTDVQVDFGAEIMGLYPCGYYADFRVIHGQAIQQAQRKFARDEESVVIAYDNLGSFGSHNNLKVDKVHYTQRGYNIMGREGAKTVARAIFHDSLAPESQELIKHFGGMSRNQSQSWTEYCGVIRKVIDGDWNVNHSAPYASSMLLSVEELSDRVRLKLNGDVGTILSMTSEATGALKARGMNLVIGEAINPTSGIVSSTDSDGYSYVDLFFVSDLYVEVDLVNQTVISPQGTSYSEILSNLTVTFPSTGRCDITHPSLNGRATGNIIGGTARSLRVNATETLTILQLRDSTDTLVNDEVTVLLPMMKIPPSLIPDTTDINFKMVAADYAVW